MSEAVPVTGLLVFCIALTLLTAPTLNYLARTVDSLSRPADQAARVLGEPPAQRHGAEAPR